MGNVWVFGLVYYDNLKGKHVNIHVLYLIRIYFFDVAVTHLSEPHDINSSRRKSYLFLLCEIGYWGSQYPSRPWKFITKRNGWNPPRVAEVLCYLTCYY